MIEALSRLESRRNHLFYSDWSLLESSGLVVRLIRQGNYQEPIYQRGLLGITKTAVYDTVEMSPENHLTALRFLQRGHSDMIDNLLYAAALKNRYQFLTVDHDLAIFITRNNIRDAILTSGDVRPSEECQEGVAPSDDVD